MKRLNLFAILALLQPSMTLADNTAPKVSLKGGLDFSCGYYKHNHSANTTVSAHQKRMGLNSTAYFYVDAQNTTDAGFTYGAQIGIETSARNTRKVSSFLYTISDSGKIELGSNKSAVNAMKITGYSNACANADLWDVWVRTDPANKGGLYILNFGNFLDAKTRTMPKEEYSRKITYYTPKLGNFQLGISYIPDTSNVGYEATNTNVLLEARPTATFGVSTPVSSTSAFTIWATFDLSSAASESAVFTSIAVAPYFKRALLAPFPFSCTTLMAEVPISSAKKSPTALKIVFFMLIYSLP